MNLHVCMCEWHVMSPLQCAGTVLIWAGILTAIHVICIHRGAKSAHFIEEATHVAMHGLPYVPMICDILGYKRLGTWKVSDLGLCKGLVQLNQGICLFTCVLLDQLALI